MYTTIINYFYTSKEEQSLITRTISEDAEIISFLNLRGQNISEENDK